MSARRVTAVAVSDAARPMGRPRSEECRQRILSAARALLEERGLRAITMEAIAERAGTSKVTLYRWWNHKLAIVLEAMRAEAGPRTPHRASRPPLESLRAEMKSLCLFLKGPVGRLLRGVVAESAVDEEIAKNYGLHWVQPRREAARALIAKAIESGELAREIDVEVTIDALFGPLYHRFILQHLPLSAGFADLVFHHVMLGVASPRTRAALSKPGRGGVA
jgi:AcrR family transcriptional regulator